LWALGQALEALAADRAVLDEDVLAKTFFHQCCPLFGGPRVRIGMPTATAERRLHKRLVEGCEENIYLSSTTADLTIAFSGGTFRRPSLHVTGGHVYAFVLHSHRTDAGVFDCM
jgi:hypothetical protein